MSSRGPDPKELRASLVDSGWSVTPPPAEALEVRAPNGSELLPEDPATRRLPSYDDPAQAPVVTQIDPDIQERLRAMQRASLIDAGKLDTTIANVTLAVGLAALAGGIVLVLTSGPTSEPSVALAPGVGGAQLVGKF